MTGLGARPERIRAAIGPCIAQPSYEVGPDLQAAVLAEDPGSAGLFLPVAGLRSPAVRPRELRAAAPRAGGRRRARVALAQDTFADETRFFSARRTRKRGGERFGLLLSAIALRA